MVAGPAMVTGMVTRPRTGLDIPIVTDATHTLLQAFRQVPGSSWIESAVDTGAGWVQNAANLPGSTVILDAISGSLYGALASASIPLTDGAMTIGPQLASVVFALPGVVQGKDFATAYVQDLTSRIIGTAAILAANPALAVAAANSFSPAIADAITQIASNVGAASAAGTLTAAQVSTYNLAMADAIASGITAPLQKTLANVDFAAAVNPILKAVGVNAAGSAIRAALRDAGATAEDLARKFGIRPDVAALAINQIAQTPVYNVGAPPPQGVAEFDPNGQPNANYTAAEANVGAPLPDVALAQAQKALSTLGLLNVFALGVAGAPTTAAIQNFQAGHNLPATGLPDAATLTALQSAANAVPVPITTTPAENATYAATQQKVQAILASASAQSQGKVDAVTTVEDVLGTLLKVTLVTSPIWFTVFVLPKLLEDRNVARSGTRTRPRRAIARRARSRA